jgi:hypothetical protein
VDDKQISDLVIKTKGSFEILTDIITKISLWILQDKLTEKILEEFEIKTLKDSINEKSNFDCENSEDMKLINLIIKLHSFDKILNENKDRNNLNFFNKELSK